MLRMVLHAAPVVLTLRGGATCLVRPACVHTCVSRCHMLTLVTTLDRKTACRWGMLLPLANTLVSFRGTPHQ